MGRLAGVPGLVSCPFQGRMQSPCVSQRPPESTLRLSSCNLQSGDPGLADWTAPGGWLVREELTDAPCWGVWRDGFLRRSLHSMAPSAPDVAPDPGLVPLG